MRKLITLLTLALAACGTSAEAPPFETWRDALTRSGDIYIVEGDLPLREEDLSRYYEARVLKLGEGLEQDEHALTGDKLWSWSSWGYTIANIHRGARRKTLSYCVNNEFGAQKAGVVADLAQAAANWERVIDVRFEYVPSQDANCNSNNGSVYFDVRQIAPEGNLGARAFFPDWDRDDRTLEIVVGVRGVGLLTHELGHVLGFLHEHRRVNTPNCDEDDSTSDRHLTSYDARSVMHYSECWGGAAGSYAISKRDAQGARKAYAASEHRVVALRASNGQFVRAVGGGGGQLRADRGHIDLHESFELVADGEDHVLRSQARWFVAAEGGGGGAVNANRIFANEWERFRMVKVGSKYAFRSEDGHFLRATAGGLLDASANSATTTARFDLIELDGRPKGLKVNTGRWISSTNTVRSDSTRLRAEETFNLVILGGGDYGLRDSAGRYLRRNGIAVTTSTRLSGDARFTLQTRADGKTAIRASNGKYLRRFGNSLRADGNSMNWSLAGIWMADLDPGHISLRGTVGNFIRANGGGGYQARGAAATNENTRLQLVWLGDKEVALMAPNGEFMRAVDGGGGALYFDRDWVDAFETFTYETLPNGRYAFRAFNGQYLVSEPGGALLADRNAVGPWEQFELQPAW